MKRPKAPEPTAQELAGVARQSRMLDEETEEMEKRLKAAARSKSGSKSLLASAVSKSGGMSKRSMVGGRYGVAGGSRGGSSGGSPSAPRAGTTKIK